MTLDEDVLAVLSGLVVSPTGSVRIVERLDRAMYTKANKALEALGFEWSRKHQSHVFDVGNAVAEDQAELLARERLERAIMTGEVTTDADLGFFPTPEPLAADLVAMADIRSHHAVLEPSAGDGALYLSIINGHPQKRVGFEAPTFVALVERDEARRHKLKLIVRSCDEVVENEDFMDFEESEPYDRVVMNPPFCKVGQGDHLDHVKRAWLMLASGGVLVSVLPAGVEFRQDKRHVQFRAWIEKYGGELNRLPEDSFKSSGTSVRTCVLRIRR